MHIKKYSPIKLGIFLAVAALLVKIYQHNRLVYLTYTHQRLSRQYADLIQECMQLRAQHQRIASYTTIAQSATAQKMIPLSLDTVVPLANTLSSLERL